LFGKTTIFDSTRNRNWTPLNNDYIVVCLILTMLDSWRQFDLYLASCRVLCTHSGFGYKLLRDYYICVRTKLSMEEETIRFCCFDVWFVHNSVGVAIVDFIVQRYIPYFCWNLSTFMYYSNIFLCTHIQLEQITHTVYCVYV
jgi:hypothetical protein